MTMVVSDEVLYREYISGNELSANVLVEKYGDALTLYINGYLKNIHDSEDLMIEAFSQVFAKERHISGDGGYKAYLFKTARNLAIRHSKKGKLSFTGLDELGFELQSDTLAETELIEDERKRLLYSAMEKLNKEYREAIYLVYFENMSYRDAGAVMKKSEKQITKLVYHGKQNLKVLLEKEGFIYDD